MACLQATAALLDALGAAAGLQFPAALLGLAAILALLLALTRHRPPAAAALTALASPAVDWVTLVWLPLFYSPALVTFPLAVQPLAGAERGKARLPFLCEGGRRGLLPPLSFSLSQNTIISRLQGAGL